jgi:hypothetical protein
MGEWCLSRHQHHDKAGAYQGRRGGRERFDIPYHTGRRRRDSGWRAQTLSLRGGDKGDAAWRRRRRATEGLFMPNRMVRCE